MKNNAPVRFRCSLYRHSVTDDTYNVSKEVVLTPWRVPSGLIGPVELLVDPTSPGKYTLHPQSKQKLAELGYAPRGESNGPCLSASEEDVKLPELEEGFFEVEEIVERRLCKTALGYEYKVRFKGYGPDDDMWLPSSSFNRSIYFETTSKYGRKRRHTLEPGETPDQPLRAKRCKKDSVPSEMQDQRKKEKPRRVEVNKQDGDLSDEGRRGSVQRLSKGRKADIPKKKKKLASNKGLAFRLNLKAVSKQKRQSRTSTSGSDSDVISSSLKKARVLKESSDEEGEKQQVPNVIVEDELCDERIISDSTNDGTLLWSINNDTVIHDLLGRDDNFQTPRRFLAQSFPIPVDSSLTDHNIVSTSDLVISDPLKMSCLPPLTAVEEAEKILREQRARKQTRQAVVFVKYGTFNAEGLRVLRRYHRLKELEQEVEFEKKWLDTAFGKRTREEKAQVTAALLDRKNLQGEYVARSLCGEYKITSQELSRLCGERHLSDETINFLMAMYCTRANQEKGKDAFLFFPSYLSENVLKSVVRKICKSNKMSQLELMFLPVHMPDHWGLAVFNIKQVMVRFDDGYHLPVSDAQKKNVLALLETCFCETGDSTFLSRNWGVARFQVPMPDQTTHSGRGHGSCGVAVVKCVQDLCKERDDFDWSYADVHHIRAEFMVEIVTFGS